MQHKNDFKCINKRLYILTNIRVLQLRVLRVLLVLRVLRVLQFYFCFLSSIFV